MPSPVLSFALTDNLHVTGGAAGVQAQFDQWGKSLWLNYNKKLLLKQSYSRKLSSMTILPARCNGNLMPSFLNTRPFPQEQNSRELCKATQDTSMKICCKNKLYLIIAKHSAYTRSQRCLLNWKKETKYLDFLFIQLPSYFSTPLPNNLSLHSVLLIALLIYVK